MRLLPLFAATVVVGLLALAALPVGFAQQLPPGGTSAYLPIVFRAAEPTLTAVIAPTQGIPPVASATGTLQPSATPTPTNTVTPSNTVTASTITGTENGFPASPPGIATRTLVVPSKPIVTNGQDLWNCTDFGRRADAELVFQANQPGDPNRLDQNNDGVPCESLSSAP